MDKEETAGKDSAEEPEDSTEEVGDQEISDQETTDTQDSQDSSELRNRLDAVETELKQERKKAVDFQAAKDKLQAQVKEKDREGMDELDRTKADLEESGVRQRELEEELIAIRAKYEALSIISKVENPVTKKILQVLTDEPQEGEEVTLEGIAKKIDKLVQDTQKKSKSDEGKESSVDTEAGNTALQRAKISQGYEEARDKGDTAGMILEKLRVRKK